MAGIFELLAIFAMTLVCLLLAFSKNDNKSIRVGVVLLSTVAGIRHFQRGENEYQVVNSIGVE